MKVFVFIALILFLLCQLVQAQSIDVEDYLNDIISSQTAPAEYMKSYLQPFSTALSTAMGGAFYHRAYTKGFPRVDIGISVVYVTIPEDEQKFVNDNGNEVATIFGSSSITIIFLSL